MTKAGIVVMMFLYCLGFSVGADYHDADIIVLFNHGVIQMPEGKATATLGELADLPSALNSLLLSYDMQLITRSFPDNPPGDTIEIDPVHHGVKSRNLTSSREIVARV